MLSIFKNLKLILDKDYVLNNTDYMRKHLIIKTFFNVLISIPYGILISIILIKLFNI